jgi:hypothetical protein
MKMSTKGPLGKRHPMPAPMIDRGQMPDDGGRR